MLLNMKNRIIKNPGGRTKTRHYVWGSAATGTTAFSYPNSTVLGKPDYPFFVFWESFSSGYAGSGPLFECNYNTLNQAEF